MPKSVPSSSWHEHTTPPLPGKVKCRTSGNTGCAWKVWQVLEARSKDWGPEVLGEAGKENPRCAARTEPGPPPTPRGPNESREFQLQNRQFELSIPIPSFATPGCLSVPPCLCVRFPTFLPCLPLVLGFLCGLRELCVRKITQMPHQNCGPDLGLRNGGRNEKKGSAVTSPPPACKRDGETQRIQENKPCHCRT